MTALVITGSLLGYLLVGILVSRAYLRRFGDGFDEDAVDAVFIAIFWPLAVLGYAVWRLVSLPTRRERAVARREQSEFETEQLEFEIERLERELGMGDRD